VIGRRLKPLDIKTDPEPDSIGDKNQKIYILVSMIVHIIRT
jgi:hypothetical protein